MDRIKYNPSCHKVTYCCSFKTVDGNNTPIWISDIGLTKERAQKWAEKKLKESSDYASIDRVYLVD